MARVDDASAAAARRILDLDDVPYAESGADDQRVHALLEAFYSLAKLTPSVPLPEGLEERLDESLSVSTPIRATGTPPSPKGARAFLFSVLSTRIRVPVTAMVMLIVALVISVGANALLSRARQFRPEVSIHLQGTGSAPEAKGVVLFDGNEIVIHADGLAELASGYRYVAWHSSGIGSDHLGSLTMLSSTTARLVTAVNELMSVVVVTIEPSASPSSPTGPQILVGSSQQ